MFQANTITEHHPTQTASQLDISVEMEAVDRYNEQNSLYVLTIIYIYICDIYIYICDIYIYLYF